MVADGIGGHHAGEIASQLASETIRSFLSMTQAGVLRDAATFLSAPTAGKVRSTQKPSPPYFVPTIRRRYSAIGWCGLGSNAAVRTISPPCWLVYQP